MRVLRGVVYMTKSSGEVDQGQSLGGHRRRKCARKTGRFHILHESSTDEVIVDVQKSCFSGVMFAVG